MMYESIAPEDPMSAPTTVIKLLFNMKPSAHNAHPEYEFNTVITTGMSAPPMAAVSVRPIVIANPLVRESIVRPIDGDDVSM